MHENPLAQRLNLEGFHRGRLSHPFSYSCVHVLTSSLTLKCQERRQQIPYVNWEGFRSCYKGQKSQGSNGHQDRGLFFSLTWLLKHRQLGGYGSSQAGHPVLPCSCSAPLTFSFHLPASNTVFSPRMLPLRKNWQLLTWLQHLRQVIGQNGVTSIATPSCKGGWEWLSMSQAFSTGEILSPLPGGHVSVSRVGVIGRGHGCC